MIVGVRIIALSLWEQHVACSNAVESLADSKVESQGPLHVGRLQASDGQAKCGGHGIDDILEGMEIVDGCEQFGTSKNLGLRFTIRNLDVVNVVHLKELEDVLRGFECDVAGETVRHDSYPLVPR